MAATKWIRQDLTVSGTAAAPPTGNPMAWRSGNPSEPFGVTVLQAPDAPLFAALVAQWQSAGRMVPGQIDTEWAELVGRIPRLSGV
ncbi:hypothetical protein SAMN05216223_110239 [Actinacidiphila yanglinensis]|uniref:Uncharacterized protein n=1 Tax=Actinacidiphila yanglinensis TaxID=310779 RepID=A0A1H6CWN1_9ACTN|nr:hypothetical protein [Actinacidiphila yanglinensis]SEG77499.1 hypothetical protein SAMN05216223_110239 [Actinacidiphila yanglinensis]